MKKIFLLAMLILFSLQGCTTVQVTTQPSDANIILNRGYRTTAPLSLTYSNLGSKAVMILISKKGYETFIGEIPSSGGKFHFELIKLEKPE